VLTTGALEALDESELEAVLAHERAHPCGRHPQLVMLLRSPATACPVFRCFATPLTRLGGWWRCVATTRPPGSTADTAALARAIRLAEPVRRGARLRQRMLLASTLAALVVTPAVVSAVCHA
jgi:hypothetical protein